MSIDGIGKPGAGAPGASGGIAGGLDGAAAPKTGEPFHVDKAGPAEGARGSDALGRLQRGDIGVDEYLDARVEDAVGHLAGKLSNEQLDFVKETLREQLTTDPVLMELVRRTTT